MKTLTKSTVVVLLIALLAACGAPATQTGRAGPSTSSDPSSAASPSALPSPEVTATNAP